MVGLYNGEEKAKPTVVPTPGEGSGFSEQTKPATAKTTVDEPSLSIAKSVRVTEVGGGTGSGPEVQAGSTFTYKLVVTNPSSWPAFDAKVTDTNPQADLRELTPINLPAGATVLSTNPLSWEIAEVPAKGSVTLEYTAKLAESKELENGDAIDNKAAIPSFFGVPTGKQQPGIEYREYKGNESSVNLNVALPQLVLHKTTGPNGAKSERALIGEEFEWRLEVQNTSAKAVAKGVDLLDTLPAGWKYVEGSAEVVGSGTHPKPTATHTVAGEEEQLRWEDVAAELGPGGVLKLNFKAIPTTELVKQEKTFTNHAVTTAEDVSGSKVSKVGGVVKPYESADTAEAQLLTPPLTIVKKPDAGEPAAKAIAGGQSAYTIEIVNGGEATATEVNVTDVLEHGNVYTAGAATAAPTTGFSEIGTPQHSGPAGEQNTEVAWTIASIPARGKVVITVPVEVESSVAAGASLKDKASVDSRQQPLPVSDEGTLEVSREADLTILKTKTSGQVIAGEEVEYNLQVRNLGPSDAEEVEVSDPIPAGTELASAEAPCAQVGSEVACTIGVLKAREERNYKVKLKVLPSTTAPIVNKATVDDLDRRTRRRRRTERIGSRIPGPSRGRPLDHQARGRLGRPGPARQHLRIRTRSEERRPLGRRRGRRHRSAARTGGTGRSRGTLRRRRSG